MSLLKILKVCRMTQDLSKSVPMVFRSPGKVLLKLCYSIFNSKGHFLKSVFLYNCPLYCLLDCPLVVQEFEQQQYSSCGHCLELPIELLIELPIGLPIVLPIVYQA